ncbi:MAG: hypothetical protein R3286_03525 [Gammaproteobacteria bacterium]|nr:hypothetical protein [Gammaproteobacteria bacterium]
MNEARSADEAPLVQRLSAVLWPAFVMAGVATGVFFTFFDPVTLLECEGEPPLSRIGAYTLGFFMFWLLCIASSTGTWYFLRTDITRALPHGSDS